MFCITCTRGTSMEPVAYAAKIASEADAQALVRTAKRYGYRDARVQLQSEFNQRQDDLRRQAYERRKEYAR